VTWITHGLTVQTAQAGPFSFFLFSLLLSSHVHRPAPSKKHAHGIFDRTWGLGDATGRVVMDGAPREGVHARGHHGPTTSASRLGRPPPLPLAWRKRRAVGGAGVCAPRACNAPRCVLASPYYIYIHTQLESSPWKSSQQSLMANTLSNLGQTLAKTLVNHLTFHVLLQLLSRSPKFTKTLQFLLI
jgi:hypothetical protein